MPKWAKILLGIIAVIAAILVAVFSFTAGMTKTADEFFAAARSGNVEQAYRYTSADFQAGTSKDDLAAFLKANALDKVTDTSWSSRAINGATGKLEGSLTIGAGGIVPVEIDLTKGDDGWKIQAIRKAAAGLQSGEIDRQPPSEQQQVALVRQSMAEFTDAVAAGSMVEFHKHISAIWAGQASVADLDRSYGSLYSAGAAFQVLQKLSPVFDKPAEMSDQGVLTLTGHYATTPERAHFKLNYVFEGIGWKLLGLSVETETVAAK